MNRKIGMTGSAINMLTVAAFAICMLIPFDFGSYFCCIFLALSYVVMAGSFAAICPPARRAAAYTGMLFAAVYAVLIIVVYFTQLTSVRLDALNEQASTLLDYKRFGLFFNLDLLGYGMMALSTFFIGLSIEPKTKSRKWLRNLMMIHGVFFISCLVIPMLGVFGTMDNADWIGTMLLEIWCLFFLPVGALSYKMFKSTK